MIGGDGRMVQGLGVICFGLWFFSMSPVDHFETRKISTTRHTLQAYFIVTQQWRHEHAHCEFELRARRASDKSRFKRKKGTVIASRLWESLATLRVVVSHS